MTLIKSLFSGGKMLVTSRHPHNMESDEKECFFFPFPQQLSTAVTAGSAGVKNRQLIVRYRRVEIYSVSQREI